MWTANPQQFVEDEDDDTFSYSVRISAQDLLLVKKEKSGGVLLSENNNWMKAISLDLSKCFIHNCKIVKSYYINSNFIIEICTEFWLNHWWKPVLDLISSFTFYWRCHMCQVVAAEFQNESAVALAAAATRHLQEAEQARNAGSEHW